MVDTQILTNRRCPTCGCTKPVGAFHRNRSRPDGFAYTCKDCFRKHRREYEKTKHCKDVRQIWNRTEAGQETRRRFEASEKRKDYLSRYSKSTASKRAQQEYNKRHPERRKARDAVNGAIRYQGLSKPVEHSCRYCNNQASEYHHYLGYDLVHQLDTIPVCRGCHAILRRIANSQEGA